MNKNYDTLLHILEKYKDTIDVNYLSPNNIAAIHVLCYNKKAVVRKGDKMFLHMKNIDLNVKENIKSYTPLQLAAYSLNYDIVYELLQIPDVDANIIDQNKNTVLHLMFNNNILMNKNLILGQNTANFLSALNILVKKNVDIMALNSSVYLKKKMDELFKMIIILIVIFESLFPFFTLKEFY